MSQEIQGTIAPKAIVNSTIEQQRVADTALEKPDKLTSEAATENYHEYLGALQAEGNAGPVKDKMARLAAILAQKNLTI